MLCVRGDDGSLISTGIRKREYGKRNAVTSESDFFIATLPAKQGLRWIIDV
jgi:hypothetical protein